MVDINTLGQPTNWGQLGGITCGNTFIKWSLGSGHKKGTKGHSIYKEFCLKMFLVYLKHADVQIIYIYINIIYTYQTYAYYVYNCIHIDDNLIDIFSFYVSSKRITLPVLRRRESSFTVVDRRVCNHQQSMRIYRISMDFYGFTFQGYQGLWCHTWRHRTLGRSNLTITSNLHLIASNVPEHQSKR